jgi:hypothetical protein
MYQVPQLHVIRSSHAERCHHDAEMRDPHKAQGVFDLRFVLLNEGEKRLEEPFELCLASRKLKRVKTHNFKQSLLWQSILL